MGSTEPTPADFDEYLATQGATRVPRRVCDGCGRHADCWRIGLIDHCERCARTEHGYDQGEEVMLRALLGGVVKAAMDEELGATRIRTIVEQAISEHVEQSVGALRASLTGRVPEHELALTLRSAEEAWRT